MSDSQSSTRALIRRGQGGDGLAWDRVFGRILTRLRRWANRRISPAARGDGDTQDAVQDAALKVWRRIGQLDIDSPGALEAYVRQTVRHRIREQAQQATLKPKLMSIDTDAIDHGHTPEALLLEGEAVERYRVAYAALDRSDREAIIARTEMGFSWEQVAELTNAPSANTARMKVTRAVATLRRAVLGTDE